MTSPSALRPAARPASLPPAPSASRSVTSALLLSVFLAGCMVEDKNSGEPAVSTVNENYNRAASKALIRRIKAPTLANLDYAAYYNNVMLFDTTATTVKLPKKVKPADLSFGGFLQKVQLKIEGTPLTPAERARPLHWTPALDHLLKWNFQLAAELANAYSAVTGEKWGDTSDISRAFQEFSALYAHQEGNILSAWVKLEFKPWMKDNLEGLSDEDKDGFPEVYAQLNPKSFKPELAAELLGDYSNKVLTEPQVKDWANTLAAYWYPTFNTDVLDLGSSPVWPMVDTEEPVRKELGAAKAENPIAVFKGRPFRDPIYNVFVVDGMGKRSASTAGKTGPATNKKVDEGLADHLDGVIANVEGLLGEHGPDDWNAWRAKLAPFHAQVDALAAQEPATVMGLVGQKNFLVFRRELEYLKAGDLVAAPADKNPIPAITAFKDRMTALGIDFLFVPIPTKQDLYPEIISAAYKPVPGNIPQPYYYKLLWDLAKSGVETVDLLTPFLEAKHSAEDGKRELYQRQDTHWNARGIDLAAQVLSNRIQSYNWYGQKYTNLVEYTVKDTVFENQGDIFARLADAKKGKFGPEKLPAQQVLRPDGTKYLNEEGAAVLVLGDSYTGVYELVGPKHAGITAHLAKAIGGPVDLIMGWGGGPEAPEKLAKRGDEYLNNKRVVVWMMTARDIFAYPGSWARQ